MPSAPPVADSVDTGRADPSSPVGPGVALIVTSVSSVQFGAALAARLFPLIGPVGTVSLRLLGAAIVLGLTVRPWRRVWSPAELRATVVFGAVFVAMNTCLYLGLDRLPLGTVITLEFLGPLSIAVATAVSWRQRGWAVPAALGVALLGGSLHASDLAGVAFTLGAAVCWAVYILLNQRMGQGAGVAGLTVATAVAALLMIGPGCLSAGAALWRPKTLLLGGSIGVLSSAIPYSLDLLALRRLPTAVFGVLTSLNPAMAALAGLLVLHQRLPPAEVAGMALVVAASAGVTVSASLRR